MKDITLPSTLENQDKVFYLWIHCLKYFQVISLPVVPLVPLSRLDLISALLRERFPNNLSAHKEVPLLVCLKEVENWTRYIPHNFSHRPSQIIACSATVNQSDFLKFPSKFGSFPAPFLYRNAKPSQFDPTIPFLGCFAIILVRTLGLAIRRLK